MRAMHHRKHGFMPGFQRVVNGVGREHEPAFLERAKARWIGAPSNV